MTTGYTAIIVYAVLAAAFGLVSMVASRVLVPRHRRPAKELPYECGIEPLRLPQVERFPVKFYVVAMLFIVFDIETIFLFPWAVAFRALGVFGLVEMAVFVALVFVAYLFILKKGGLEWEEVERPPDLEARPGIDERPAPGAPEPEPVGAGRR